jgi:hypothetical protein
MDLLQGVRLLRILFDADLERDVKTLYTILERETNPDRVSAGIPLSPGRG